MTVPIRAAKLGFQVAKANLNLLHLPFKLTFCVTFRCQSRCQTCNIWQIKPEKELTLEEIEKFASKAGFLTWVNITGGEPFLREDLVEICRVFSSRCSLFLLNFATNGLMPKAIPEIVKKIIGLPISRIIIGVSLDGSEMLNDSIRGIPGDWKKAIETYRELKSIAVKHRHFRTYVGYTVSPYNQGKFFDFYEAVKREIPDLLPRDIHVNLFHSSPHYFLTRKTGVKKEIFVEELEAIKKFRSTASLNPVDVLERSYLELAKSFLLSGKTPVPCHAVDTSCYVDSWGNVYPCTIYDKKIGSLRESDYDLTKILQAREAKEARKDASELNCPNCWTPCEAYQMILANLLRRNGVSVRKVP